MQLVHLEVSAADSFFMECLRLAGKPEHQCSAHKRTIGALGVERDGVLMASCLLVSPASPSPGKFDPKGLELADIAIRDASTEEHSLVWQMFSNRAQEVAMLKRLPSVYIPIVKPDNIFNVKTPAPPALNQACLEHGVTNCHLCRQSPSDGSFLFSP